MGLSNMKVKNILANVIATSNVKAMQFFLRCFSPHHCTTCLWQPLSPHLQPVLVISARGSQNHKLTFLHMAAPSILDVLHLVRIVETILNDCIRASLY